MQREILSLSVQHHRHFGILWIKYYIKIINARVQMHKTLKMHWKLWINWIYSSKVFRQREIYSKSSNRMFRQIFNDFALCKIIHLHTEMHSTATTSAGNVGCVCIFRGWERKMNWARGLKVHLTTLCQCVL